MSTRKSTATMIAQGEIHIWIARAEHIALHRDVALRELHTLERARFGTFLSEPAALEFLTGRFLLRRLLSSYDSSHSPSEWVFETNQFGKPVLHRDTPERSTLSFNVSHSKGVVACAIAKGIELGVDVERIPLDTDLLEIARVQFSSKEVADLEGRSGIDLRKQFNRYWTLKESYVKSRGLGLSQALNDFSFKIGGERQITIVFDEGVPAAQQSESWNFALKRILRDYHLAVAYRSGATCSIVCKHAAPSWPIDQSLQVSG